jgi:hypothetical protein
MSCDHEFWRLHDYGVTTVWSCASCGQVMTVPVCYCGLTAVPEFKGDIWELRCPSNRHRFSKYVRVPKEDKR